MGLTALAVDLGHFAQVKEHAVTAAQDAVLSAVPQLAPMCNGCGGVLLTAETDAVSAAETYLLDNFSVLTSSDFNSCTNSFSAVSSLVYVWPTADCFAFFDPVSFSSDPTNPTGMGVALPPQLVDYSIGKAVGLQHQAISAVAFAALKSGGNGSGLPFSYPAAGGAGLQCLKTSGASTNCGGFSTGPGNFGVMCNPRFYMYVSLSNCSSGGDTTPQTNLVVGIDHFLWQYPTTTPPATAWCDAMPTISGCPGSNFTGSNQNDYNNGNYVNVLTGQTLADPTAALFGVGKSNGVTTPDGSCTLAPRLNHLDGFTATGLCSQDDPATSPNTTLDFPSTEPLLSNPGDTFGSTYALNGTSIDAYLNTSSTEGSAVSKACDNKYLPTTTVTGQPAYENVPIDSGFNSSSGTTDWTNWDGCLSTQIQSIDSGGLTSPPPATDWIFNASIEQSPRFGIVPLTAGGGGTGAQAITGFAAVYLDIALAQSGGKASKSVGAIVAFVFPETLIEGLAPPSPGGGSSYNGGAYSASLCSLSTTASENSC